VGGGHRFLSLSSLRHSASPALFGAVYTAGSSSHCCGLLLVVVGEEGNISNIGEGTGKSEQTKQTFFSSSYQSVYQSLPFWIGLHRREGRGFT